MVSVALHCDIVVASSVGAASYRDIGVASLLPVDPSYWDTVVKPLVLVCNLRCTASNLLCGGVNLLFLFLVVFDAVEKVSSFAAGVA